MDVRQELLNCADINYKEFHKKLVPTVDENKIIGVRIPQLRKIGKKLEDNSFEWYFYEEIMLHGFYIGYKKLDYKERLVLLDEFVPRIDNWAVCDCVCSTLKFIEKNKKEFLDYLPKYMYSDKEYEVRFSTVILMDYYICDEYIDFVLDYLTSVKSSYYYVNMAVAWALSVAFVKYKEKVLPLIKSKCLPKDVHNMTISKIRDSLRVDSDTKKYLKTLRV